MDLGEKIKKGREAKGLTRKEVAEVIGIDMLEVASWEDKGIIPEAGIRSLLSLLFDARIDLDRVPLEEEIKEMVPKLNTGDLEEILSYLRAMKQGVRYGTVLSFEQCSSCDFTTKEDLTNPSTPCPNCGKTDETRMMWPGLEFIGLIDSVHFFSQLKNKKIKNISVILFCSLFEGLLEDFLETFLKNQGNSKEVICALLNCYKNVEARIDNLYKQLASKSFIDDLKSMGFKGWYENWKEIKTVRNQLLHVKTIYVNEDTFEKVTNNSKDLITIFANLNNKYCLVQTK